jgi:glycine/D-amino acid oxidase-like deaminating enzyme/nitrite reductase/ring-hydroxylating ferredoxin subunit
MIEQSLWRARALPALPDHKTLPNEVDVVVIGAGITGLTTAYLLKKSGKRVAVFDRERIGSGESGNTSAHLTCVTDERITALAKQFGEGGARVAWEAGTTAIDLIESNASEGRIACRFRRVPGYLCAPFFDDAKLREETEAIRADAELAARLGFPVTFADSGPLTGKPALAIADQAIFHPLEYIAGLALAIDGDGSFVREHCEVGDVIQDPLAVVVDGNNIACADIVVATHVPVVGIRNLVGATLFQTKLYPYSSYILGARLPAGSIAPGLYDDTTDPYFYLRVHEDADGLYAVFGGEDHKTGQQTDTEKCYARLEDALRRLLPEARVERRWSGQVIETSDGLPFIGEVADHQYAATGYAGNGLTFGTAAGMIIHDAIMGARNPWRELFDPRRKAASTSALRTMIEENVDYPLHYVADRLRQSKSLGIENVPRGEGRVVVADGKRVAVHRKDDGSVVKVSAVCTHMGCLVRWNNAERTWDCPCHGSRFTPDGLVLGGPAESPLEPM